MSGRATPMFDPRDVRNSKLIATVTGIGVAASFPAPADNNANRLRYLLAFAVQPSNGTAFTTWTLQDLAGNDYISVTLGSAPGPYFSFLTQPLFVIGGATNGLRLLKNAGAAADGATAWVLFADVQAPIVPAFAVSL